MAILQRSLFNQFERDWRLFVPLRIDGFVPVSADNQGYLKVKSRRPESQTAGNAASSSA
jgi:hypothetical protein